MNLACGWLTATNNGGTTYYGIPVPRTSAGTKHDAKGAIFPTRIEEYGFATHVLEQLPKGTLFSAGAGFNPEIHVMEYIAASMGYNVMAIDANAEGLQMPAHPNVQRFLGNAADTPFPAASYDVWLCISVLEHMSADDKQRTLREALRLLKSQGIAIITTDNASPLELNAWLSNAGFLTGAQQPFNGQHLEPQVSYAVAQKA